MKLVYTNSDGEVVREIKMTNFDRITATPEALADFISKVTIAAWFAQANSELPNPNGSREWLAWLKQENEEK